MSNNREITGYLHHFLDEEVFFCMAMVVEELGDYYNVEVGRDEHVDPLVREINKVHHVDEARHLAFGRLYLKELFERYSPQWSAQSLAGFRDWLAAYLKASWADYYNPSVYRDAGIADAYEVRQMAIAHPAGVAHLAWQASAPAHAPRARKTRQ